MFGWTEKSFEIDTAVAVAAAAHDAPLAGKSGLLAGTKVATQLGWRPVETVAVGDEVLTFDNGLRRVVAVEREIIRFDPLDCDEADWPLCVPAGALGNKVPTMILPGQAVMIESDAAEMLYGDPFAVVPAEVLDGYAGIERCLPENRLEIVTLRFEEDELVFVSSGLLIHCARTEDLLERSLGQTGTDTHVLSLQEAVYLIALLEIGGTAELAAVRSTGGGQSAVPQSIAA